MRVHRHEMWKHLMQLAKDNLANGKNFDEIFKILLIEYNDEAMVYAIIRKLKSEYYAEKSKEGRKFLFFGSILMFSGFLITCVNFHSNQSINFAMYGLTTVGLILVFVGLYKIF